MKISVQSLFEDYEENTVPLSRDADAERILEKTRAKLPGVKRKRPLGLVLVAAAAAVAVLCGAAAIVHYATVGDGAGSYIMPDTLRYDEENKKTILVDTPFEWNNPISFDTEGRTKGKVCGMRLGWLPEGWGTRLGENGARLSGGERQRLSIARAIAADPPILLLDEVTTGLDLSVQAAVLDLIQQIRRDFNVSMLVVSHDLGVIRMLADRTLVMLDGRVIESGLTDQILEDPQHAYTQQLVYSLL